jgi:hypothetical protein
MESWDIDFAEDIVQYGVILLCCFVFEVEKNHDLIYEVR